MGEKPPLCPAGGPVLEHLVYVRQHLHDCVYTLGTHGHLIAVFAIEYSAVNAGL